MLRGEYCFIYHLDRLGMKGGGWVEQGVKGLNIGSYGVAAQVVCIWWMGCAGCARVEDGTVGVGSIVVKV